MCEPESAKQFLSLSANTKKLDKTNEWLVDKHTAQANCGTASEASTAITHPSTVWSKIRSSAHNTHQ